ncbi:Ccp1p [Sugiyamaella lignohabitans]|uniref:Peroxidase n=1 Tax=Sugiyamaella lignohabitans TaxID=796027 RepID=A0A167FSE3_9ASCO|nr:Ccp1p [Sugiyamaella lignohabitans]ANB15643.1 Ccp1p [Sugiyamaella lignohabitans]
MHANGFSPVLNIPTPPSQSSVLLIHISSVRNKSHEQAKVVSRTVNNFIIASLSSVDLDLIRSEASLSDLSRSAAISTPTQSRNLLHTHEFNSNLSGATPKELKTHSSNYYNPRYLIFPAVIDKIVHRIKLTAVKSLKMSKPGDYNALAEAIRKIIPQEDYDDGSIGPILVRLAWHASGTYDAATGTGGSNGATMRYSLEAKDSANNGLEHARRFLEPIKEQFPWISYADLWTFAGAVAVEYMDGPKIPWKPGRVDYVDEKNVPPNGRLPDGALGQDHLRQIFYRMGFNDQEIVALCGAHNLGRTHADRSGFDGPWVPNPTKFGNTYYKLLLHEEWTLSKSPAGLPQYYDADKELMMLPADFSLILDPEFKKWVEIYAEDKDRFYADFAKAFGKLLELGVRRGPNGLAKVNELGKINVDPAKI